MSWPTSQWNLTLPNQTWVHSSKCSKAYLLMLDCGEGQCSIYCKAKQSVWAANAQKDWTPHWLLGKGFQRQGKGESCEVLDQLVDILLIGWWWHNQESTSSTFWFQLVWGLHVHGHHAVNSFHLMGVLISVKQLKNVCQVLSFMFFREELKILWLYCMADLLFKLLPVLLTQLLSFVIHVHILATINSWTTLLWPTEAWETKAFPQKRGRPGHGEVCPRKAPIGSCFIILRL